MKKYLRWLLKYSVITSFNAIIGMFAFLLIMCLIPQAKASSMSEAQARNCIFHTLEINVTTERQALCTLKRRKVKHLDTTTFKGNTVSVYVFRSSRFGYTNLIFRNKILISISQRQEL